MVGSAALAPGRRWSAGRRGVAPRSPGTLERGRARPRSWLRLLRGDLPDEPLLAAAEAAGLAWRHPPARCPPGLSLP